MTAAEERRLRSRDVPQACRVRACRIPKDKVKCPTCERPVFREIRMVIQPAGARL